MQNETNWLAKELARDCRTVEDIQEKLNDLFKDTIQHVFEAEIDNHLGYKKHDNEGDHSGNSLGRKSLLFGNLLLKLD
ncbi:hypothetical protein D0466_18860 [Peribacillus glennii]|uniref:IS256 family transposase n=1 Tax=Peribacillus glennii TaxID=2303991 RepID=A0A372L8P8_9BACI|nr:hypothetical protein D0466_18860 [Peribacillus glennii]